MKKKYEINIIPTSAEWIFNSVTNKIGEIAEIILGENVFSNSDCKKTENREWYPEDRVGPPHCPYEDVIEEEWIGGPYQLVNFLRQHSADDRLSGSGGYGFMTLNQGETALLNIQGNIDSPQGYTRISFNFETTKSDDEILNIVIELIGTLNFREVITSKIKAIKTGDD